MKWILKAVGKLWWTIACLCVLTAVSLLPSSCSIATQLGERGAGHSEGQLQRLAIARAICSGKPVLLPDEAISALDEQTEAKVLENLKKLTDRTVIIVTHRKAALDICNRIVEMDNGRIYE